MTSNGKSTQHELLVSCSANKTYLLHRGLSSDSHAAFLRVSTKIISPIVPHLQGAPLWWHETIPCFTDDDDVGGGGGGGGECRL